MPARSSCYKLYGWSNACLHIERYWGNVWCREGCVFFSADSPVLWLRIDPDMQILRKVAWQQPDFMWNYQLRHERDVVAQAESLTALADFPTPATRQALMDTIDDDHCFYKVRTEGTYTLVKVRYILLWYHTQWHSAIGSFQWGVALWLSGHD